MRASIKAFTRVVADYVPILEPIYEFGSLQVPGQGVFADLRPLFPKKKYVGCDMRSGPGVDLIADMCTTGLAPESVGTILSMDTLEHVEYLREALIEMFRILRYDGVIAISSVMDFPIHDYPQDFWRFTPEGFKSLLKPFHRSIVESVGREVFPHTVVGVGFKDPNPKCLHNLQIALQEWKKVWEKG